MTLVSVVLPIYNVEDYISRCLNSIISQTYKNIEILLVDDGSKDRSGAICDNYSKDDSRIKVFHLENAGVAKAREYGVLQSKGDYIVFVDPDDWMPLNAISELLNRADDDIDIIIGGYASTSKDEASSIYCKIKEEKIGRVEYIDQLFSRDFAVAPWAKLYRTTLFSTKSFPNFKKGQDYLMNFELATRVNQVLKVDVLVYYYFKDREEATSKTHRSNIKYERLYNDTLNLIIKDADLLSEFRVQLLKFTLGSIKGLIESRVYFDTADEWLKNLVNDLKFIKLTKEENLTSLSIRFKFMQRVQYRYSKIKPLLYSARVNLRRLMIR